MGRFVRLVALLLLGALSGCGGGGGGSGGGSNSPNTNNNGGLTINPTALSFTAQRNAATPSAQLVNFSITATDVAFVGADISNTPAWLNAQFLSATPTSAQLSVFVTTTNLAPGTYTATLPVGIARADQSIIATRDVAITYTVTSKISAAPAALTFTQFIGEAPIAGQSLTLSDNGGKSYAWTTSVTYQEGSGWLTVSPSSGASLSSAVTVSVNPSLAPGTYHATIVASGGGDSVSVPVTYSVRQVGITTTQALVSFSAKNRQTSLPDAFAVGVTSENSQPVSYTRQIVYGASATGWLTVTGDSTVTGLLIRPSTVNLPVGTHTATITLTPANGAPPVSVSVQYTVQASTVTLSASQVTFAAVGGQAAALSPVNVTITAESGSSVPYTATVISYGTGATGWLGLTGGTGSATGTLTLLPNTTALEGGTYRATVRVTPDNGVPALDINVTYTVTNPVLTFNTTPVSFALDITSTAIPANLNRSVTTGSTAGAPLTWTVSSPVPWLSVSSGSGGAGSAVTFSLVLSEIDKLDAGTVSTTLTFNYMRPSGSSASAMLPVNLDLRVPRVNYVAPYAALSGTSKEVILRGSGFNNAGGNAVMFDTTAVSTYDVVSDTEIRITHPTFTAGSRNVRIPNQLGINRTGATLVVVDDVPSYPYAAIPTSLPRDHIIHDLERGAVYTNNWEYPLPGTPRIERHRLISGSWVTDSLPIPRMRDIALTPDGRELIAISATVLYHIDLSSFTIASQMDISTAFTYPYSFDNFYHIAMGNDGDAIVLIGSSWSTPFRYNVRTKTFAQGPGFSSSFASAAIKASADGSRMIIGQNGITPEQPSFLYIVSQRLFTGATGPESISRISYDRTGTTSIIDGTVYNKQFVRQGLLGGFIPAISPDGTRGYAYVFTPSGGMLRTYDLTTPNGSDGFVEIGSGIAIPDSPGASMYLEVSADGRAVFITGDEKFIVQPLP